MAYYALASDILDFLCLQTTQPKVTTTGKGKSKAVPVL
jgi:hypothetical protein